MKETVNIRINKEDYIKVIEFAKKYNLKESEAFRNILVTGIKELPFWETFIPPTLFMRKFFIVKKKNNDNSLYGGNA
jgi:hypothetical protein